jgi:hypothetical protein
VKLTTTDDDMWVYKYNVTTKQQSSTHKLKSHPTQKKAWQSRSHVKTMHMFFNTAHSYEIKQWINGSDHLIAYMNNSAKGTTGPTAGTQFISSPHQCSCTPALYTDNSLMTKLQWLHSHPTTLICLQHAFSHSKSPSYFESVEEMQEKWRHWNYCTMQQGIIFKG